MFPYYLSIGMPSQEFWCGDPWLACGYRKAHELRNEQRNQELWMQGLYNYKAFQAVIDAFSWGLVGKKGARPQGYIDKPIDISPKPKQTKEAFLAQWKARKEAWKASQQ